MLRNIVLDWSGTLVDDLMPVAEATNPSLRLMPHALGFLRFCQATHRRVFLLCASEAAPVNEELALLEVSPFFEKIYAGERNQRHRIREILSDHQLRAEETGFIGHLVQDVQTARLAGVMSIAIRIGYHSAGESGAAAPDLVVRDLAALQTLLESDWPQDAIRIEELEIFARVGVPDEERAAPQRLSVSITLQPRVAFADLADDLAKTVDYGAVCAELQRMATSRADRLIETLADAMAAHLLAQFPIARIKLELCKFILPQTKFVSVRITRTAAHG